MSTPTITVTPPVVSKEEWLKKRLELLESEKEATRHLDRVNAERRRLPMTEVEKDYVFQGPSGPLKLEDLFEGRRQLIVYHFMFGPDWERGCIGCTGYVDAIGDLSLLHRRDATFVLISRAPYEKLAKQKEEKGWRHPWYSSYGTDFNYDFHVTLDESVTPVYYNYRTKEEMIANQVPNPTEGEEHGLSVFLRTEDGVFHTYSSYARGTDRLTDATALLEVTPYGRQEDWEDSPEGWPQRPTYG